MLFLLLCLNVGALAGDKNADRDESDEALVISLAPNWKLANQRWVKNEHVVQYLPAGSDQENPVEMITITTVTGVAANQTAKNYIFQVRNAIESAKEGATLKWHLLSESGSDACCEYTLSGHLKVPNQHEIMRVIRGGAELHSIIYHFGKITISEAEHERALNFVNSVKLAPAGGDSK